MSILSEEFVFAALEAEKQGNLFPINFEDIWETFDYSRKDSARRYLLTRSGLKRFSDKQFHRLAISYQLTRNNQLFLSVDSYKFALARANTPKGEEYLVYLIQVEKAYRQQLERNFSNQVVSLEQELHQIKKQLETQAYPHTWTELHEVSNIKSKYQVRNAIKEYFKEGRDYVVDGKEWRLSPSTFNILVLSFRSLQGTNIRKLPSIIAVQTLEYFQYQEQKKRKNQRVGHRESPGQLSLEFDF